MERPSPKHPGHPAARQLLATLACNATFPTVPYNLGAGSRLGRSRQTKRRKGFLHAARRRLSASEPGSSCLGRCTVWTDQRLSTQSVQFGPGLHWCPSFKTKWSGRDANWAVAGTCGDWDKHCILEVSPQGSQSLMGKGTRGSHRRLYAATQQTLN
jgi:hypothetical protein